ncbi:MAG: glycosyltransferase family 1 protein [Gemmataceae bacterium]|nr:glycosyltransferase family 1 protein [Gemmataceae bacterium]
MRVILNQSTALGPKTGIGHYTSELLQSLRVIAPTDTFDIFPPDWWRSPRRIGGALRPRRGSSLANADRATRTWRDAIMNQMRAFGERALGGYLRLANRWHRYDIYHEPNYIPLPSSIPTVATVHDLSVLLHPEWHPLDRVRYYEREFQAGLQRCRHLFAVSEFTRQEMVRELNIPAERITCTHLGIRADLRPMSADETAAVLRRLGLPEQYLLFVGTIEPRKNPMMLMRAYCDLPAAVRERCPLVLAGGWGWNAAEFAAYYEAEAKHRGVMHLGYVADADLAAIYCAARALVFPSFYEGFGLPPLEMMACGGAVLASTAGSVVEVVGPCAHLLDPNDLTGWRDAMQRIIVDDDWQRSLRVGVTELARTYSWERCARQTLQVYRDME